MVHREVAARGGSMRRLCKEANVLGGCCLRELLFENDAELGGCCMNKLLFEEVAVCAV
jgi:hypothetical protein